MMSTPYIFDMVHHNPGESRTQSAFTDPKHLAAWGYTGQVMHGYIQAAVTFDAFDRDIFPVGSEARQWLERHIIAIEQQIRAAKEAGIHVLFHTDFIVLPTALVEKYRHEVCDADGKIDIHRPFTKRVVNILIDEIFRRFPDLDGLVVRHGETYLHDIPYHSGNNPILQGTASHIELINTLREAICVNHGKLLCYRTWDFNGIHEHADRFLEVTDAIEPHPLLLFSIKHTQGDFWRTIPFNPCLGQGRHRQIVEVQCQREYEGKGAHPNYIAHGVIEGFEEYGQLMPSDAVKCLRDIADHPNFAGVWTWSRGGGWKGPKIEHELWCEVNAGVLASWARQPERSEADVFDEVCERIGIAAPSREHFRRLCLLSADGVLRGQASYEGGVDLFSKQVNNSEASSYYSIETGIEILWTRDEYIGGFPQLSRTLDTIFQEGRMAGVMADRETAVRIWEDIEDLANTIRCADPDMQAYIAISAKYGCIKYQIFEQSWKIMLLAKSAEQSGRVDRHALAPPIVRYDALWQEWRDLKAQHSLCATLYNDRYCRYIADRGMVAAPGLAETIDAYR